MTTRHCAECGHSASGQARFCEWCGAVLTPPSTPPQVPAQRRTGIEGERKQVTVMYADVVGSMDLTRSLDAERWGLVLDRFLAVSAASVQAFEGTVNQFTGDGMLAVFGAPVAHEDHARRACLAVLELQRRVHELSTEIRQEYGVELAVRCGLNSGEVVVGAIGDDVHMDFVPVGNTTAIGKRIEELAPVGSTAMSAATAALVRGEFEVRELGEFDLKGVLGRQLVLELVGPGTAQNRLEAMASTRGLVPFVGRGAERAVLGSALDDASAGRGSAVGIVGDAGIGKSRLVHEFVAAGVERGLAVYSAGGVAHGRYVPFLPVLALYRNYFGVGAHTDPAIARAQVRAAMLPRGPRWADDLPMLFEFLGIAEPGPVPGEQAALDHRRRLLEVAVRALTASGPTEATVIVLEDLHWIDDASDAFLTELVEAIAGTRILLLATYRSEYDDAWTGDAPHARIALKPLQPAETEDLLTGLVGTDPSVGELTDLIDARTRGNPFFIEEVVQALVENGQLAGMAGDYRLVGEVGDLTLPATVEAVLAARIDDLPRRERALVQVLSVVGQEIPGDLLTEIADLPPDELAAAMQTLEHGQWIVPGGSRAAYLFKHPLTQEVAYRSQLSEWRQRAHGRVAAAIERTSAEVLDERAALLAHHYEAAGDVRGAATWHSRAAAWAEVASPAEGMRHWRRLRDLTATLVPSVEQEALAAKARLGILSLGWRLGLSPDEEAAAQPDTGDEIDRGRARLFHSGFLMHSGNEREGLDGFFAASRDALVSGDPGLILTASSGVAYASWVSGDLTEGVAATDHAIPLVAGDPTVGSGLAFISPLAHAYSQRVLCRGYQGDLVGAVRDFDLAIELARSQGDDETVSATYAAYAMVQASFGDPSQALENASLGLAIAEEAANAVHVIACLVPLHLAQVGAGFPSDAAAGAGAVLATVREHRIGLYFEPVLLSTVALARLALGEIEDAVAAAEEAAAIADARGLGACALIAPITLAQVLRSAPGADPGRIEVLLSSAMRQVEATGADAFEPMIRRELAALA
ncbi:guanylate cyclase [Nocardioides marmoriginsengisoli]|uniref:Guanylate cyclase n=1 Tax=Nocardioides marmoriginsengisoli TaxID=661483 RepID=A0A3N0CAS1_9ACTN|nr:AAA family ATPase [Nocardioides marmoriginsengisoli]RNL60565.1 guanylate cyclase [Nocardioides marmoriginsengisoli]